MLTSQEIGLSLVSFQMIFEALQSSESSFMPWGRKSEKSRNSIQACHLRNDTAFHIFLLFMTDLGDCGFIREET